MDFESVFNFLLPQFTKHNIRFALIGGFALHASGFMRTTQDIDILVLKDDMPKVKTIMDSFGYQLIHESEDVSNFLGKMKSLGRVDFLHAHREYAVNMLKRARECGILEDKFKVKVILPEDIIGLKVQSSSNDPMRHLQDMADIEQLLIMHRKDINMDLINEYFTLFNREDELKIILAKIDHVK